jgi:hypothetical protein
MKQEESKDRTSIFNRLAYGLFIVLAIYQIIFRVDYIDAASSMGIALIFDPFDQTVKWPQRPIWQRAWLIIHLLIAISLLVYGIALDRV